MEDKIVTKHHQLQTVCVWWWGGRAQLGKRSGLSAPDREIAVLESTCSVAVRD